MAQRYYIWENPAYGNVPEAQFKWKIPSEGEVFKIEGRGYGVVSGGKIYEFGKDYFKDTSRLGLNNPEVYAGAAFNPEDVGYTGELKTYNPADIAQTFPGSTYGGGAYFNPATQVMVQNAKIQESPDIDLRGSKSMTPVEQYQTSTEGQVKIAGTQQTSIPFKEGLSEAQKQSITNLVNNKPVSQWTETDKANWNYVTNSAALPNVAAGVSGAQQPSNIPFKEGLSEAQKQSIINLTNKPVDQWTETDKKNWSYATNNAALPAAAATATGITGAAAGTATTTDIINQVKILGKALGLDDNIIDLVIEGVKVFPEGTEVNNEEVINVFNDLKSKIIDPYYQSQINVAKRDIEKQVAYQKEDYQELEKIQAEEANERIRQQQLSLEARGFTFSGEGVRTLGTLSAARGATGEGVIPLANRRIAESSRRNYLRNLESIGFQAEQLLGSEGMAGLNIPEYQGVGGVMGNIPYTKFQTSSNLYNALASQESDYLKKYKEQFMTFIS